VRAAFFCLPDFRLRFGASGQLLAANRHHGGGGVLGGSRRAFGQAAAGHSTGIDGVCNRSRWQIYPSLSDAELGIVCEKVREALRKD
jgi:hypothetical protein